MPKYIKNDAKTDPLNQKFLQGGPGGAVFSKSAPPGRRRREMKNDKLTRRSFLKYAFSAGSMCSLALMDGTLLFPAVKNDEFVREAKYYEKQAEKKVTCKLCPHECRVADLERGTCGVRVNRGGTYYTLVYGNPCSAHIDPIEKKPVFHYYPTTEALSIATAGCNFVCKFCQNWEISQKRPEQVHSMKFFPGIQFIP